MKYKNKIDLITEISLLYNNNIYKKQYIFKNIYIYLINNLINKNLKINDQKTIELITRINHQITGIIGRS